MGWCGGDGRWGLVERQKPRATLKPADQLFFSPPILVLISYSSWFSSQSLLPILMKCSNIYLVHEIGSSSVHLCIKDVCY